MRLNNIEEINAFLETANQCEGKVWLETPDGDRFNLKSKFSQYVAMAALLGESGEDLELFCQLPEDRSRFFKYFREYPGVN